MATANYGLPEHNSNEGTGLQMTNLVKRGVAGVFATALVGGSAAFLSAGTAEALPWGCTTTPVVGTAAFSQCGFDSGWHRVHVTCWNWWGGSNGGWYERWGNPAWGDQQSWSSCDVPFSLRTWDVVTW